MSDPKTAPSEDLLKRAQEIYERLMREHGFDFYNDRRPSTPPRTAPPAGISG